jgi:hypothetical protein
VPGANAVGGRRLAATHPPRLMNASGVPPHSNPPSFRPSRLQSGSQSCLIVPNRVIFLNPPPQHCSFLPRQTEPAFLFAKVLPRMARIARIGNFSRLPGALSVPYLPSVVSLLCLRLAAPGALPFRGNLLLPVFGRTNRPLRSPGQGEVPVSRGCPNVSGLVDAFCAANRRSAHADALRQPPPIKANKG